LALTQGDTAHGVALLEESLALLEEQGDTWAVADTLDTLGDAVRDLGDAARATTLYRDALAHFRELGNPTRIFSVLLRLGSATHGQGDTVGSTAHYHESLALFRELELADDTNSWMVWYRRNLGHLAHVIGDDSRARELLRESLRLFRENRDLHSCAFCMVDLAGIVARHGQPQRAAQLFGASQALRGVESVPWPLGERIDYEQDLAAVRAQLDEATFALAWAAGQAMPLEQAIEYALSEDKGRAEPP
jgi:tetratricopeptide (TPR) repeat protein